MTMEKQIVFTDDLNTGLRIRGRLDRQLRRCLIV
jgi:hypothetical protein